MFSSVNDSRYTVPFLSALTILVSSVTYLSSFVANLVTKFRCYNNLFFLDISAENVTIMFIGISNRNVQILHYCICFLSLAVIGSFFEAKSNRN